MSGNQQLRTVVCGSRFGQFYMEALNALPGQFKLTGLLAKGSVRSQKCAERYGIELYTDVGQLPADTDLACVVLRSGVMGGDGTAVSLSLLSRGIHVIQEQPVHHKDLADCLRMARKNGVYFRTGDLYVHLPAVRRFIACARHILELQQALYLDAACATQVSFPLMHILLDALPSLRPWKVNQAVKNEGPFQLLTGVLGNIPMILRAHNEVDPQDSDNHLHLLHRLTIGVDGGSLSLVDTHGPVIWQPRLHVPEHHDLAGEFSVSPPGYLLEHSTQLLGPAPADSYQDILLRQWPQAIGRDLTMMRDMIREGSSMDTRAQQELLVARLWQDVTGALGYPVLRSHHIHQPLASDVLHQTAAAVDEEREECAGGKPLAGMAGLNAGQVRECLNRLEEAALSSMLFALQSQGTLDKAKQKYRIEDIFSTVQVASRHQHLVLRWLQLLAERGWLTRYDGCFGGGAPVTAAMMLNRWELVKEAWNGKLGSPLTIEYLISNAEQLPQLLSGAQQAALLLFPEGRMDIASALYRDTMIARFLNQAVAETVMDIVNSSKREKLHLLELGAGTGATTDVVVNSLNAAAEQISFDYLFTDISNFFLAQARQRFKKCPWMEFRVVNIDENLFSQGLTEPFDIVIAAGMLNNARNVNQTMQNLMLALAPGGWLLITEPVREFPEMLISQAFMMTRPEDDRKNTKTTFLSTEQWLHVFRQAGAQDVKMLPGEEHPLALMGQKLFIVRKGV
ncbi:Gfo/Idh/MocA family oxidoreductase|uniref:Thiazolinyl imide reductase n=1 Tax=Dendrosporobacter quercicolus TaxID=146817 RepID=A0A1G9RS21_9FIRM|nr:bifunctional Gfo/Idh/MocA family oxidoreductase/class I SAM-dependent methyltransferase [Dendrosporobacter quercicolus]NSL49368.1 Gfo/Idh/MocA family oxidoreductase [Dendrosporobacter quercicolus DSM 1736]SDM25964.1 thiazolinyl imide reductase [Dendrosporobacter quercicolus]